MHIGLVVINVSEVQNNARAHVVNNISHVEQMIVSRILHTIITHIGPVGTNVSQVQNNVRACVAMGTLLVELKIASQTQHSAEISIEHAVTSA